MVLHGVLEVRTHLYHAFELFSTHQSGCGDELLLRAIRLEEVLICDIRIPRVVRLLRAYPLLLLLLANGGADPDLSIIPLFILKRSHVGRCPLVHILLCLGLSETLGLVVTLGDTLVSITAALLVVGGI